MRYDKYKNIPELWNCTIPDHWEIKPLVAIARKKSICNCTELPLLSVYLDAGVVPFSSRAEKRTNTTSKDLTKYQRVDPGDFVLNNQQAWRGSVGISKDIGIVSPAYIVLSVDETINSSFANYLLRSRLMVGQYVKNSKGVGSIQRNIYWSHLKRDIVFLPPKVEQDQIVRYLDWQVSKINKLIRAKKKEISLLDEGQRSQTCCYVANGISSGCKMKDSGINWAKQIPSHWDVLYLSQVTNERSEKNAGMIENNLLSLSYGHIISKDINTTDGLLPASFEGYQIVLPNNIVLRLTDLQNDHKSLRVGLSDQKGIITSAYTCLNVHDNILPEYLYLQLHAADLCKVFYGMGGGVRQSIGYKEIRKLLIAVPPLDEQKAIVEKIYEQRKPTEAIIIKLQDEIKVLEELKKKIISDVVTGQMDVRNIEIPNYEYIEEEVEENEDDFDEENEEQEVDE